MEKNKKMQDLCRMTMDYIKTQIHPGMGLIEIRDLCEKYLLENGADSFWYHNVGAFCFSGFDTTLSFSARHYQIQNTIIQENDVITIDLSPQLDSCWGDFARTIIVENGQVVDELVQNEEWRQSLEMEKKLHQKLIEDVTPTMTFEELFVLMSDYIEKQGFVNLDFSHNLGHSIEKESSARINIEKGNHHKLGEVSMFTFEPHIKMKDSKYGFKCENIYYFENNQLVEL